MPWGGGGNLSPDDRLPEQVERLAEYKKLGAPHVVVLDPEQLIA